MMTYPFLLQASLIWTIEQCSCRLFNLFAVFLVDRPEFSFSKRGRTRGERGWRRTRIGLSGIRRWERSPAACRPGELFLEVHCTDVDRRPIRSCNPRADRFCSHEQVGLLVRPEGDWTREWVGRSRRLGRSRTESTGNQPTDHYVWRKGHGDAFRTSERTPMA